MATTPALPDWIRDFRADAYTNIYELLPEEPRLYGTESLFGDWSGELLLLAKDFAPRSYIDERIREADARPYRHAPEFRTNKNIIEYSRSLTCDILYGSALVGLLRNDDQRSGALPDRKRVWPYAIDVLRFTLAHMPNLRAIACLGHDAWRCAAEALDATGADFRTHREQRRPAAAGDISIFALPHPSRYPGGKARIRSEWIAMGESMGFTTRSAARAA